MNWCKLSLSQLNEFLTLYQEPEQIQFSLAVNRAQVLFDKILPSGIVTNPVRDLYIAFLFKRTSRTYRIQQIRNIHGSKLTQFAQVLQLDSLEPNIHEHLLSILFLAELLVDESQLINLPEEIIKLIALHIDYDELRNLWLVNKKFFFLSNHCTFWIDKIYHDFQIITSENSTASYVRIATQNYCPVRGSEEYAHSCRDLCRLLFAASKIGKPTEKLEDKINALKYDDDLMYSLKHIGQVIKDKSIKYQSDLYHIGSLIAGRKLDRAPSDYCHNVAGIIRGDNILPKFCWERTLELFNYAALFDNVNILEYIISERSGIISYLAQLASAPTIQCIYNLHTDQFMDDNRTSDIMGNAMKTTNIEGINKLVELGIELSEDIVKYPIVIRHLFRNMTNDDIDFLLWFAVEENYFEIVDLFYELGADVNRCLRAAVATNNESQISLWISRGATDINGALLKAVESGTLDVLEPLINAGATNINMVMENLIRYFILHLSCDYLEELMIPLLGSGQVDIDATLQIVIGNPAEKNYSDKDGELVRLLMKWNPNNIGKILEWMIECRSDRPEKDYLIIVKNLLKSPIPNLGGALKLAIKYHNEEVVDLIKFSAGFNSLISGFLEFVNARENT